jgi:hypothetical protein
LDVLPLPIVTTLSPATNRFTVYFRRPFLLAPVFTNAHLRLAPVVDDGAVFWLNGFELCRLGMTNGAVAFNTPAVRLVGQAGVEGPLDVVSPRLSAGTNLLAAEVHQWQANDPDLVFGLGLEALVLPSQLPSTNASLAINPHADAATLSWSDLALFLESAPALSGPWVRWPNARSPLAVSLTNGAAFFRLRE